MSSLSSITLTNVSIKMQGVTVLDDITLGLQENQHLALLGSSGSGKTTLVKALTGKLFREGTIQILFDENSKLLSEIVLVEQRYAFKNLSNVKEFYYQQRFNSSDSEDAHTVLEEINASIESLKNKPNLPEKIEHLLTQLGMQHRKFAPVIQLSSGEHKRFQLIKTFLNPPQILLLDSPFTGLDVHSRMLLMNMIDELALNGTKIIIITDSNQLPDCITHIAVLENGKLAELTERKNFITKICKPKEQALSFNFRLLPYQHIQCEHFNTIVKMVDVCVEYNGKKILSKINWEINNGEKWLLKGHNGAGKSTLLSLINGDNPQAYSNEIYLFGKRRGSGESIWDIKQKTGYLSPEADAFFDKRISIYEAVASGLFDTMGLYKKLSVQQQRIVIQWLDFLQISSHQSYKPLAQLSTGGQRLTLLVRAFIKNPPLLILDEPCQGLDEIQKEQFVQLIDNLCKTYRNTLIYVSHYENEIPECINDVFQLDQGEQTIYKLHKPTRTAIAV